MSADALPPTLDEFVADPACASCGETVASRWLVDDQCPGCRYGGERA